MRTLILTASLLVGGCNCSQPGAERAAAAESGEVAPEPSPGDEPTEEEAEVVAAADPSPRLDATTILAAREAIREGRRLAGEGSLDEALAAFERALEVLPGAPRVRCEVGYIASRAGDNRRAARELDVALALLPRPERAPPELRVPLAMCLYNRGRVYEALEDPENAARVYRDSLSLRDNRIVRGRLEAIVAAQDPDGEARRPPPSASIADLRAWIDDRCGATCDDYDEPDPEECFEPSYVSDPGESEHVDGAVLFTRTTPGCGFEYGSTLLTLRGPAGWWQTELMGDESSTTDNFYRAETSFTVEASIERATPTIVRVDLQGSDSERSGDMLPPPAGTAEDPGCLLEQSTRSRWHAVVFCETGGATPRCGMLDVGADESSAASVYCEGGDPPAWALGGQSDTSLETEDLADHSRLRVDGDAIVIERVAGETAPSDAPPAGRYTPTELLALMRTLRME